MSPAATTTGFAPEGGAVPPLGAGALVAGLEDGAGGLEDGSAWPEDAVPPHAAARAHAATAVRTLGSPLRERRRIESILLGPGDRSCRFGPPRWRTGGEEVSIQVHRR
ncbi:hypothetical protein GCM10022226_27020 [Sphaerisporangium flaviroseum]|uniref:Uncharacterized protein n=1 Tax=Sphaerisporangium flaviroseum TaxID=509199 RepID=A0ABP7I403_9ACTN